MNCAELMQASYEEATRYQWDEAKHPRGQPENAGEFGPGGGHKTDAPEVPAASHNPTASAAFRAWFGNSKVVDKDGKPLVVYHGSPKSGHDQFRSKVFPHSAGYFAVDPVLSNTAATGGIGEKSGAGVYPVYLSIQNPLDIRHLNGDQRLTFDEFADALPFKMSDADRDKIKETYAAYPTSPPWSWAGTKEVNQLIRKAGHDGIAYNEYDADARRAEEDDRQRKFAERGISRPRRESSDSKTGEAWIAFEPSQIKSAIGNSGTFDPKDPRIQYARDATHYAVQHAPKGGVTIDGVTYPGGEFIPSEVMAKATPEEKAAVEGHAQEQGKTGQADAMAASADYKANGTKAKAFKAWFGDWESGDFENVSKVIDDDGTPKETYEAKRVFHGTDADFDAFDTAKTGQHGSVVGKGFYFAENEEIAKMYSQGSGKIIASYLNIRNPFYFDTTVGMTRMKEWAEGVKNWWAENRKESIHSPEEVGKKLLNAFGRRLKPDERELIGYHAHSAVAEAVGQEDVNAVMKSFGYDGIMHESRDLAGTPRANMKQENHGRIWIAFEPNQIKAVDNSGTFDPSDDRIHYGAAMTFAELMHSSWEAVHYGLFDEQAHPRDDDGRFSMKDMAAHHVQAAKSALSAGTLKVTNHGKPIPSDASGKPIRRSVDVGGKRVHPDELHRLRHDDAGVTLHDHEKLTIHDPMGGGPARSFSGALASVGAYSGRPEDVVTIQSAHGYGASMARKQWAKLAGKVAHGTSFSEWHDEHGAAHPAKPATGKGAEIASAKETEALFKPTAGGYGGGLFGGPAKKEEAEPEQLDEADVVTETKSTKETKSGVVWARAKAGGEVSPVNGEHYKGGRWMPIHGLSPKVEKKEAKPPQGGDMPKPPDEDSEAKARGRREPRTPASPEDEKERREHARMADEIKASPLEKTNGIKWNGHPFRAAPGFRNWKEYAETLTDGDLRKIVEKYKPADENGLWEYENQLDHPQGIKSGMKAHHKQFPSSAEAHTALTHALEGAKTIDDVHAVAMFLKSLGAGDGQKRTLYMQMHESYLAAVRYAAHDVSGEARDEGGKWTAGKEPWEMTRKENGSMFAQHRINVPVDRIRPRETNKNQDLINEYAAKWKGGSEPPPVTLLHNPDGTYDIDEGHHRYYAAKKAGKNTMRALVTPVDANGLSQTHRAAVESAIAAGKPVPAHVLADYPDLKTPAKPAPASPMRSPSGGTTQGRLFSRADQPERYEAEPGSGLVKGKQGDYGHYVTLGASDGHKGHVVFIVNGNITEGHPSLAGKKIGPIVPDRPTLKEGATRAEIKEHKNKVAGLHRAEMASSKEHERKQWGKKAKKAGLNPDEVHTLAGQMKAHHDAFTNDVAKMLGEVRKSYPHLKSLTARAGKGGDSDAVKGMDDVADSFAKRSQYSHLFPRNTDPGEHLFDLLSAGNPQPMSEEDAYESAFDHLMQHRHQPAHESSDEPIPFGRGETPMAYAMYQAWAESVQYGLHPMVSRLAGATEPAAPAAPAKPKPLSGGLSFGPKMTDLGHRFNKSVDRIHKQHLSGLIDPKEAQRRGEKLHENFMEAATRHATREYGNLKRSAVAEHGDHGVTHDLLTGKKQRLKEHLDDLHDVALERAMHPANAAERADREGGRADVLNKVKGLGEHVEGAAESIRNQVNPARLSAQKADIQHEVGKINKKLSAGKRLSAADHETLKKWTGGDTHFKAHLGEHGLYSTTSEHGRKNGYEERQDKNNTWQGYHKRGESWHRGYEPDAPLNPKAAPNNWMELPKSGGQPSLYMQMHESWEEAVRYSTEDAQHHLHGDNTGKFVPKSSPIVAKLKSLHGHSDHGAIDAYLSEMKRGLSAPEIKEAAEHAGHKLTGKGKADLLKELGGHLKGQKAPAAPTVKHAGDVEGMRAVLSHVAQSVKPEHDRPHEGVYDERRVPVHALRAAMPHLPREEQDKAMLGLRAHAHSAGKKDVNLEPITMAGLHGGLSEAQHRDSLHVPRGKERTDSYGWLSLHKPGPVKPYAPSLPEQMHRSWEEATHYAGDSQPRDDAGRWAKSAKELLAAHPRPAELPENVRLTPGTGRPDLIASDPKIAAAAKAKAEHADSFRHHVTASAIHDLLTGKPESPVPLPKEGESPGRAKARAKRAIEAAEATRGNLDNLGDAFATHHQRVAASHPHGADMLKEAKVEAIRRHQEAVAHARKHVEGLPEADRERAEKSLAKAEAAMKVSYARTDLALQMQQSWEEVVCYEVRHAPVGGVTVQGVTYPGGEFIPAEVMAKATPEERAAVEGHGEAAGEKAGPATPAPSARGGRLGDIVEAASKIKVTDDVIEDGEEVEEGVWGTDFDGNHIYNFSTSAGSAYSILVHKLNAGYIQGVRNAYTMQFSDASGGFGVTGAGGAIEVFSKVSAASLAIMKAEQFNVLHFSAAEPSRQKLYDRLVKTLAAAMPGYGAVALVKDGDAKNYLVAKKERIEAMQGQERGTGVKEEVLYGVGHDGKKKPGQITVDGVAYDVVPVTPEFKESWLTPAAWRDDEPDDKKPSDDKKKPKPRR